MKKIYTFCLMLAMMAALNGFAQAPLLSEGFEGDDFPPAGWTTNSGSEWEASEWETVHSGSYCAFVDYNSDGHNSYLITPQLNLDGNYMLHFYYGGTMLFYMSGTTFTIEISTTGTSTSDFTVLQTMTFSLDDEEYEEAEIDLSAYNGESVYIAFHVSDYDGMGIILDDVTVEPISGCPKPSAFTATIVSSTEIALSWNGSADNYNVEYGEAGFTHEDGTLETVDENTITLDIDEGVTYDFYVQADCGDETSIWIGPITVNTSQYVMPTSGSDTITTCGMVIYDNGGPTGDYSTDCSTILVIYPEIEDAMVSITGTLNSESSYDYLNIYDGVGTSGTRLVHQSGTNQSIAAISTTGPLTIEFTSDYLVCYGGFELMVSCVSCYAPGNIATSGAPSTTSATLTWNGDESGDYVVTLISGSDSTLYQVNGTSLDLDDLTPASFYTVYIQTVCDDGSMSMMSQAYAFHTACDLIDITDDNPWTENFDGYAGGGEQPFVCWDTPVTDAQYHGPFVYCGHYPSCHSGANSAELKGSHNMLVLPEFSNDIHMLRLSFWATTTQSSTTATVEVGVITDVTDTSTFEPVALVTNPGQRGPNSANDSHTAGWGNFMGPFDFSGVEAEGGRIAIRYANTSSASASWNLDDFTVSITPDCAGPLATSVRATGVAGHTATISWTDNNPDHSAWMVYYKPTTASQDEWLTQSASDTSSVELTDLIPETTYQVYVVTVCGGQEGTDSTMSIRFTTDVACPAPSQVAVSNMTAEAATLSWFGASESYTIEYDTLGFTLGTGISTEITELTLPLTGLEGNTTYTVYIYGDCGDEGLSDTTVFNFTTPCATEMAPYSENFAGFNTAMSPCWKRYTGLASDVFNGGALTASTGSWYFNSSDVFPIGHPKLNVYGTTCKSWLVSPIIDISELTEPALMFSLALTDYYSSDPIEDPTGQADDKFMVIISTDGGTTWSAANATVWDNTSSGNYSYNAISATGDDISIPLSQYAGNTIRIAFYGESTVYDGDNDLHIANVMVDEMPTCPRPSGLSVTATTNESVTLTWTPGFEETEWEIAYGPAGDFDPDAEDAEIIYNVEEIPYEISDLSSGTEYAFYVRANCGSDESLWLGPVNATPGSFNMSKTGTDTLITCNATIYDDGGANGNYSNGCNGYLVLIPEQDGSFMQVSGTLIAESSSYDYLVIYDGIGSSGPQLFRSSQTGSTPFTIPTVISTSGPLTLYFHSDVSSNYAGFELTTSCATCAPPAFTVTTPSNTEVVVTITSDVDSWDLEYGEQGFEQGDGTMQTNITASTFTVSSLESGTVYDFYVRTNCTDGASDWVGPVSIAPGSYNMPTSGEMTVTSCGAVIYDDGGVDGNYSNNYDGYMIVNPDQTGMMVQVTGTLLAESSSYDYLIIYDGAGSSGTQLYRSTQSTGTQITIPPTTSTTGPLTIYFHSDFSNNNTGFELYVSCVEAGPGPQPVECNAPTNVTATNITKNSAVIDWTQDGTPVSWTVSYKKADAQTWTAANVTAHPYTITDLDAETAYNVKVTANCDDTTTAESNTVDFTTLPDGVNEYVNSTVIFPNPTTGQFTISNTQCVIERVEVMDVYGKLLNTVEVNDNTAVFDVTGYASGVYFTRIRTDKGIVTKRVVKK